MSIEADDTALECQVRSRLNELMDEYHLSPLHRVAVQVFVQRHIGDSTSTKCRRARSWLVTKLNKRIPRPPSPLQSGCPDAVPGLTGRPFWTDREELGPVVSAFMDRIERDSILIQQELQALRTRIDVAFQPYRAPSWSVGTPAEDSLGNRATSSGDWKVFYLDLHGQRVAAENAERCPVTSEALKTLGVRSYGHALFSALIPGTEILPHYGPTNKKLRIHLPLCGVKGSQLTVGGETFYPDEGKAFAFDDSFLHEAKHYGNATRFVLIVDVWHPDLSNEEIKFFSTLRNSQLRREREVVSAGVEQVEGVESTGGDDLFSIVERASAFARSSDDREWWTN